MRESIKIVVRHLEEHPDRLLAGWVFFGSDINGYYLINRTFLTVAGIFDGVPKAFRIPGAVEFRDDGDRAIFTGSTVRVVNGPRQGILMPVCQVKDDEEVTKAGLGKYLVPGPRAHQISGKREGDHVFLSTLVDMYAKADLRDELRLPEVYLSVKEGRCDCLRARSGETVKDTEPLTDQVPGKILYPYDKVYGHGVCITSRHAWHGRYALIPADCLEKDLRPDIRIDVLDYMNNF